MNIKIVSGGQTGVDRAALDFARNAHLPCGGWCPPDRRAEDGIIPADYPLREMPEGGYRERTWKNVIDSDGTLVIYEGTISGGTAETVRAVQKHQKPLLQIDAAHSNPSDAAISLDAFIQKHRICCLNVAGPRTSQWEKGYIYTIKLLRTFLRKSNVISCR